VIEALVQRNDDDEAYWNIGQRPLQAADLALVKAAADVTDCRRSELRPERSVAQVHNYDRHIPAG
jgi:hypothetical protein